MVEGERQEMLPLVAENDSETLCKLNDTITIVLVVMIISIQIDIGADSSEVDLTSSFVAEVDYKRNQELLINIVNVIDTGFLL